MKISVVITAGALKKNPAEYIEKLIENKIRDIIIVCAEDDKACLESLKEAANKEKVTLICEGQKESKKPALKKAFSYLKENRPDIEGAICCRRQYAPEAVKECMLAAEETPGSMIFAGDSSKQTSERNLKDRLSSLIYRFAIGMNLKDTTSGLFFVPANCFEYYEFVPGKETGYESRILITVMNKKIPYREIFVNAPVEKKNIPFKEAFLTYCIILAYFLKFAISSVSSYLIDMGVYAVLLYFLESRLKMGSQVLICTVVSRIISSLFNYTLNRKTVFKAEDKLAGTAIRYYIIAVAKLAASYVLIFFFTDLLGITGFAQLIVKALVDIVLFLFSFQIQKNWVFKDKNV